MTTTKLTAREIAVDVSRRTGCRLYGDRWCGDSGDRAEAELDGRSHYYDASTRRGFGCRVLSIDTRADGLVLVTVESVAHPSEGRLYRAVAFDLLGNVIHRTGDGTDCHGLKTAAAAKREAAALEWDTRDEADRVLKAAIHAAERQLRQLTE